MGSSPTLATNNNATLAETVLLRWIEVPDISVQLRGVAPNKGRLMEKLYKSTSGKYTGVIVGTGKLSQCLLDEVSKGRLAVANLKLVRQQN